MMRYFGISIRSFTTNIDSVRISWREWFRRRRLGTVLTSIPATRERRYGPSNSLRNIRSVCPLIHLIRRSRIVLLLNQPRRMYLQLCNDLLMVIVFSKLIIILDRKSCSGYFEGGIISPSSGLKPTVTVFPSSNSGTSCPRCCSTFSNRFPMSISYSVFEPL